RIQRARDALEPRQHVDLRRVGEAYDGIRGRIEPTRLAGSTKWRRGRLPLPTDRPHRVRRLLERGERDVVRIRERLLVAADGAHADAAVDVERARLDDALLEAPAFEARMLKVEVREIDIVGVDRAQHARDLVEIEVRRRKQQAVGIRNERGRYGDGTFFGHCIPWGR